LGTIYNHMAATKFKTRMINVRELSKVSGVSIHKIYNRRHTKIEKPLDIVDSTKMLNALTKEVIKFSKDLGFEITFRQESQD
jgi:hypothetical protein